MSRFLITLLLAILSVTSCKKEATASHIVEDKTILIGNNNYYYSIAIPYDYNDNDTYTVFLALHWGGNVDFQSGANFLSTFALEALENYKGFIVAPSCPEPAGWIHDNSQAFVLGLIESVLNDYRIDSNKIIIGGFSMGGVGTWYYGSTFPEIFKVAVPIASLPPIIIEDIIPTYVIHGVEDEVFSVDYARNVVRDIKTKGNVIRFTEVKDASHYETNKYIDPLAESLDWIESYLE